MLTQTVPGQKWEDRHTVYGLTEQGISVLEFDNAYALSFMQFLKRRIYIHGGHVLKK